MPIRKSVRDLDNAERSAFVRAVVSLKQEDSAGMPGVRTYDTYVVWHMRAMMNRTPWMGDDPTAPSPTERNSAHRGPTFLPWHRQFFASVRS